MKNSYYILEEFSKKIKNGDTIIFDMDETLINTNLANYFSYRDAIREVAHMDIDEHIYKNRRFDREELKKVTPHILDDEIKRIIILKEEYYKKYVDKTEFNTIFLSILNKFNKKNAMALVTNCQEDRALLTMNYHGIIHLFDHILFGNKCNIANKYDNAIKTLNLKSDLVFVFENDDFEIEKAIIAGIPKDNIIKCFC